MLVGVPKEIKVRVGLSPSIVREFVAHGHEVLVETGAGAGIDADDSAYIGLLDVSSGIGWVLDLPEARTAG